MARDRRDRDQPLPPRPLGRPRAVGLGDDLRAGPRRPAASRCTSRRAGATTSPRSGRSSAASRDMFERAFDMHEYAEGVAERGRRVRAAAGARAATTTIDDVRASASPTVTRRSRTRPTRRRTARSPSSRATPTSSSARRRSLESEPEPRGHLSLDEAEAAFAASGARRLLVTHRPLELPVGRRIELARDGLELELCSPSQSASRAASAERTLSWIDGIFRISSRKARSVTTSSRSRRGRDHRRRPRPVGDERDLAEEVARPHRVHLAALAADVGRALDQDEELAPRIALARQHLPLGHVDLVGDERDLAELLLRAVREERHPLQQLDLGVAAEHRASLNRLCAPPSERATASLR